MRFSASVKQTIRHHLEVHALDAAEAHQLIASNCWGNIDCVFSEYQEIEIEDLQSELKDEVDDGC